MAEQPVGSVAEWVKACKAAWASGDLTLALEHSRACLSSDPDNIPTLWIQGRVFNQQRDWEQAARPWSRLVELTPDELEPRVQLLRIHQRRGDWAAALELAKATLALCGPHPEVLRLGFQAADRLRDLAEAAGFARHLVAAPGNVELPSIIRLVGRMLELPEHQSDALDIVCMLTAADPANPEAARQKTRILATMQTEATAAYLEGDVHEAAAICRGILRAIPEHDRARSILRDLVRDDLLRARAAYKAEDLDAAVQAYETVLSIDPDHVESVRSLARLHAKVKDYAKAVARWRQLEALTPDDEEPKVQVARAMLNLGRLEEAFARYKKMSSTESTAYAEEVARSLAQLEIRLLRKATSDARNDELDDAQRVVDLLAQEDAPPDGLSGLQDLLHRRSLNQSAQAFKAEDYQAAYRHARRALANRPNEERSLLLLARAAHRIGDFEAARTAWQTLRVLQPESVEPLLQCARYHSRFKELDQAEDMARQLLARSPEHGEAASILQAVLDLKNAGTR